MTTKLNLNLQRGENRDLTFTLTNEDGSALDLTGALGVWMTFKRSLTDADSAAVWQGVLTTDITIGTPATAGVVTVSIPNTAFSGVLAVTGQTQGLFYDFKVEDSANRTTFPVRGVATIAYNVTQTTV